ncbi:hypothetical protein DL95DRAFT_417838 [Leptodontidium sp. 2 PMI_412]|nr:hypothetical protein DL95DRAFT_417838 [Leptodontidium sp. 2 PMI_412]
MPSRRGKSRAADQEEAGDGYNWSEWGWDEKAKREGRYRLNSKENRSLRILAIRNSLLVSLPSPIQQPVPSQEYYEGGQENYHWSPQTSQSIDRLTEEFDNTSIGHAGVTTQDSYRDSSPLVDSTTGPGTSQPIETPSSPWRPTATAAEFVPSSREGGYFASSNSYTSGMNPDPHGMVGPSQDHHQATQQYNRGYDGGYDDDSSVMSSSVETVVPSRRRRHAASSSMNPRNDTVSMAWRNATTPPPVVTSFDPPMTSQGTFLRYLTSEQNTEQNSAAPLEALLSAAPNTSGSGDNTPQGLKDIHMNIATTTDGTKEKLDSNFRVHRSKYFQPGEVFKVLWSEPEGDTARSGATEVTRYKLETQYKGENVYSSIRRFVIAATDAGHCQCLSVLPKSH